MSVASRVEPPAAPPTPTVSVPFQTRVHRPSRPVPPAEAVPGAQRVGDPCRGPGVLPGDLVVVGRRCGRDRLDVDAELAGQLVADPDLARGRAVLGDLGS